MKTTRLTLLLSGSSILNQKLNFQLSHITMIHFLFQAQTRRFVLKAILLIILLANDHPTAFGADSPIYPIDVTSTKDGTIYIADLKLPGVWELKDGEIQVVHQASKTFRTPLNAIRCIKVDDKDTIYAGDSATRNVYRFDKDWKAIPLYKQGPGIPSDLIVNKDELFVSDLETQRVWKSSRNGGELKELAVINGVRGLTFDQKKNIICVTTVKDQIRQVSADGSTKVVLNGRPLQFPHQVEFMDDSLFVADNYAGVIWRVPVDGSSPPVKFASGEPLKKPVGLGLHKDGLLVADPHAKGVFLISNDGTLKSLLPKQVK